MAAVEEEEEAAAVGEVAEEGLDLLPGAPHEEVIMTAPSPRSILIRQVVIPLHCVRHLRQHQSWRPLISRQGGLIPRPGGIVVGAVKALGIGLVLPEATLVEAVRVLEIVQVLPEATLVEAVKVLEIVQDLPEATLVEAVKVLEIVQVLPEAIVRMVYVLFSFWNTTSMFHLNWSPLLPFFALTAIVLCSFDFTLQLNIGG